ncbi:hypothetical protein [Solimonas sp. SE-A11]|uniref:hypothetical protein n=1 Tax=Solimonas sp. SE-A11 TaxID=3054954 RepID=UPI00259CE370|nr:hypothetical protein [Solimonas sp. SE-A11]MDM4770891.1 hypothetical protein [Solimonas sp. SE-A11]
MELVQTLPADQAAAHNRIKNAIFAAALMLALIPVADAGTTGAAFQTFYTFINDAATGYLGRGIALTGGVIGLGMGAATGKALPAAIGIVLAIFGALGPAIVNSIFASAII